MFSILVAKAVGDRYRSEVRGDCRYAAAVPFRAVRGFVLPNFHEHVTPACEVMLPYFRIAKRENAMYVHEL